MIEMDLSGVRHIQARIAAIQDKFGIPGGVPGMDFDSVLNKAIHQGEKDQLPQAEGAAAAKAPEAAMMNCQYCLWACAPRSLPAGTS